MRLFKYLLFLGSIISCTNTASVNENAKTINIDVAESVKFFDADNLLDSIGHEIIMLDTVDNNFIGHVSKLSVMRNSIYIWDRDNNAIFIYDINGKYLSKIASQGRAKNEYIGIDDFYVSKEKLYILDNVAMKLLVYDVMGKYIKTLDISMYWANGVFAINDMIYLINYDSDTQHGKYHVFKIDTNGNLKDRYMKFNGQSGIGPDINIYSQVNNVFNLCILPENNIYQVDSFSCGLAYKINFVNKNLPKKYYKKNLRSLIQERVLDQYILGVEKIQESLNYVFLNFRDNKEYYTALYNKSNNSVTVCEGIIISSAYKIGLGSYYICDNYIYEIVDANLFKILVSSLLKKNAKLKDKYMMELERIDQKITEDNNPLIIKYKLKC
ncbi:6-bladed beta-propeller [Butyricimonas paravirosa]